MRSWKQRTFITVVQTEYLNNYSVDMRFFYRYFIPQRTKPTDFSSSATVRLTFLVCSQMSQQQLVRLP